MKFKTLLTITAGLMLSSTAMADYIVNGTGEGTDPNAGGLDTLLGETSDPNAPGTTGFGGDDCTAYGGSSLGAEECWAESVLGGGVDLTLDAKLESDLKYYSTTPTGSDTLTDVYAFDLRELNKPGYVVLKNAGNWALVENLASLDWATVSLAQLGLDKWNLGNDTLTISHYTGFNPSDEPPDEPVPEPGTLGLLGLGLVGMGIVRRRRKAAA